MPIANKTTGNRYLKSQFRSGFVVEIGFSTMIDFQKKRSSKNFQEMQKNIKRHKISASASTPNPLDLVIRTPT
jgi:hypothetical protein